MLLKIAWRNIWRSPLRSFVVIGAVMLGVWSVIALMSFSYGLILSFVKDSIQYQTSHIQLHNPEYKEDKELKYTLSNPYEKVEEISKMETVQSTTMRTLVNGMISTSAGSRGGTIRGVVPDTEANTTSLKEKIIEGDYFSDKKNQILVGKPLAKKLNLKLRKKVVLQFQNKEGDIVAGAFRVVGVFDTKNTIFDENNIFVNRKDLNKLLGDENMAHEIAVLLKNPETLDATMEQITKASPGFLTENYRDISPDVKLYEANMNVSAVIFIFIFMLALVFGIINTMLMAVLERNKELGMLMAVGLNKWKVFKMILLETLILGSIGAPVGMFLGWLTVNYLSERGIDLSAFSAGMEQIGMSTMVYPAVQPMLYVQLAIGVSITAFLAAIYPALKAISLRPVEAMRKI